MSVATRITCKTCGRSKAPRGRSVPVIMAGSLCEGSYGDEYMMGELGICPGYNSEPRPDCRWPGEKTCGPGCTK